MDLPDLVNLKIEKFLSEVSDNFAGASASVSPEK
jgi:hypothetical protein